MTSQNIHAHHLCSNSLFVLVFFFVLTIWFSEGFLLPVGCPVVIPGGGHSITLWWLHAHSLVLFVPLWVGAYEVSEWLMSPCAWGQRMARHRKALNSSWTAACSEPSIVSICLIYAFFYMSICLYVYMSTSICLLCSCAWSLTPQDEGECAPKKKREKRPEYVQGEAGWDRASAHPPAKRV